MNVSSKQRPAHATSPQADDLSQADSDCSPNADTDPSVDEELAQALQERDEYYDSLLRKQAEFENYRKRVIREKQELRDSGAADVLAEILPIIDGCEKGLQTLSQTDSGSEGFRTGYELLLKALHTLLKQFQVEPVPGVGAVFDPQLHEAVVREVDEAFPDGQILEEYRRGYRYKGRLLRASQVKVSANDEMPATNAQVAANPPDPHLQEESP